ncbi:cytochrome oxidase complex assembly protein 1 [Prosthecobacter fusiformis]|uniref:Cytochrome oxidase complex assembly protein 1 n=1 Tax=Prosthecobacter fusiformis TaxID=48464 RepID=A0A4V3FFH6_9BACT|nr:cytochrome c oxidase assembly factor 1 family protein [Prosthecobacter fusiformis]TDU70853.1 cytochrome oxidase complex assembly protein 1 [Prosthecobacter fusiformis]
MNTEPPPFGDPTNINRENAAAVKKGVAVGCGGCLAVILLAIGFVASIFFIVMLFMRGADASVESLKRAQNSPQMKEALGEPIQMGWWVMGSFNSTAEEGQANLTIPVSGPRGSASIQTEATKEKGTWNYTRMTAELPTGTTVDLLQPLPSP